MSPITDTREYQTVILGALLHDIGKLIGRSDVPLLDRMKHPAHSAVFISAHPEVFSATTDVDLLKTLVQRHHESPHFPEDLKVQGLPLGRERALAMLVSRADNLSSGEREDKHSQGIKLYKIVPLASVTERLEQTAESEKGAWRFTAKPLNAVGNLEIFPVEKQGYQKGELDSLIKESGFGGGFSRLFRGRALVKTDDFDCLFAHLLNLLYRYTWCIPSDTQEDVPDVSLFDHLKTTAAIAACLYQYHEASGGVTEAALNKPPAKRFRLVVGDLSGIQSYIFDISSAGVGGTARRLRARSLFVHLCSEVASQLILEKFSLLPVNVLMNSGGKFYVLVPNLPDASATVHSVQEEADRWFMKEFNGELALNLADIEFGDEGFDSKQSGFGTVLDRISAGLENRKLNRFVEELQDGKHWNEPSFILQVQFEGENACNACRKFPATEDGLCRHCSRDRKTGARLPDARYLGFHRVQPGDDGAIPVLNRWVTADSHPHGDPYLILKINDPDLSDLGSWPAGVKYLATHIPKVKDCHAQKQPESDDTATFEMIASESEGEKLLGFLKADVDHLGKLFIFGLKRDGGASLDTVSRIATMSRQLDLFFSGWVEQVVEKEFPATYTVFSGGDDLFMVGPWNNTLKLVERLRADFDKFTVNPVVTFSAAIEIGRPDCPVSTARRSAEESLKNAKHGDISNSYGNKLAVLGHYPIWTEWTMVRREWEGLKPEFDGLPSVFGYNLLRFGRMWKSYCSGDTMALRLHPMLAYMLARNLKKSTSPITYELAESLIKWPVNDTAAKFILNNLVLITNLLIKSREGVR
ncbi:MAG: type III-A CRISPR-associated protein Cas10/Csm1 [Chloroflexota bacterium]